MSASSAVSTLRWVKYEDIYYAALLVPSEEAPTPVESGHAFVYFLGSESGAIVPIENVEPYDATNTARVNHPAAAAGVIVAQQIISGAEDNLISTDENEKETEVTKTRKIGELDEEGDEEEYYNYNDISTAPIGMEDENNNNNNNKGITHVKKEPTSKKVKDKSDKKNKDKDTKKKSKKHSKYDTDNEEDENNEKYKEKERDRASRKRKGGKRLEDDDDDDDEAENALLQLGKHDIKRLRNEEESQESSYNSSSRRSSSSRSSNSSDNDISSEAEEQQNRWDDMEEDLNFTPSSPVNGTRAGSNNNNRNKNNNNRRSNTTSTRQITRDGFSDAHSGSTVAPFLAEIRHYYRKALVEAAETDRLVNLHELDLIRAVEARLITWSAEVSYLQSLLQKLEQGEENDDMNEIDNEEEREEEIAALRSRLNRIKSSFNIERVVHDILHVRPKPAERRERRRHPTTTTTIINTLHGGLKDINNKDNIHNNNTTGGGRVCAFMDASLSFLLDPKAAPAHPRELPQQLARKYKEQRGRREVLLTTINSQQGLGKLGFTAPGAQVMARWRQSRELLALDPKREAQPASRRYSESLAKVERHALKCCATNNSPAAEKLRSLYRNYPSQNNTNNNENNENNSQHVRAPTSLYNFNDLHDEVAPGMSSAVYQASSSHPFMPSGGNIDDMDDNNNNNDNEIGVHNEDGFQAPLASPLRTSFDPRATFAIDHGELMHENTLAEQLAMQSMQYSQSIYLPSQETLWERSEAYETGTQQQQQSKRMRRRTTKSTSRAGSMSRASSRASSLGVESNNNNNNNNNGDNRPRNDWRASAKRAILEQLTLYLRGIRGRPAVLSKDMFQSIGKKLLERAVRSESERTGLSMSLQANNASAPFTRDIEARLRKSVDNYIQRHFITTHTPKPHMDKENNNNNNTNEREEERYRGRGASSERWGRRQEEDDETRSVMGAYPHATDSPVYDQ